MKSSGRKLRCHGEFFLHRFRAGEGGEFFCSDLAVEEWDQRHVLRAADHESVAATHEHFFGGLGDALEAAGAVAVDRDRRDRVGDARAQGDDAGDVRGVGGLGHAADDDLLDGRGVQAGPGEEFGDGDAAQFGGVGLGEGGPHFGEGGADAVHDVDGLVEFHGGKEKAQGGG